MDAEEMVELLRGTADAVTIAMHQHREWGLAGTRHGQYHHDLAADAAALEVLEPSGVTILSEESGVQPGGLAVTVVIDPIDGSTNASRGLPWWSTSLCAVDSEGPWVALVADQVTGERWRTVREGGAFHNDERILRPATPPLRDAIIGLGGWPPFHFGWNQFRAFGAIALDLCAVADGRLDGYVHCVPDEVAEWDYLGGMLVCLEAGADVIDIHERAMAPLDHSARRTPIAAGDRALLDELLIARRKFRVINRKRKWVGRVLRAVPTPIREFAVRRTTPSYVMGAMCRLEREDGRVLLVKPSYRTVWTLPGGVSDRGESPIDCMHRELLEETGLRCEVVGDPVVMVDPKYRIFDFVYRARLAPDMRPDDARAVSLEIAEVGWFEPGEISAVSGPFARKVFLADPDVDGRVVVVKPNETPERGWWHRR